MEGIENGLLPIRPYKENREIVSIAELPIAQQNRTKTDNYCTIVSSLFAIAMLITACVVFRPYKLIQMTYPTDQQGRHCTLDNSYHNFLYFTSPTDPNKRLCVAQCPKGNETQLSCWPTDQISCNVNTDKQYEVMIYATIPQQTSIGLFCLPEDPALKQTILHNANLANRLQFVQMYRTILISALISVILGLLYLVILWKWPFFSVFGTIISGGILSIGLGILFIALPSNEQVTLEIWKVIFSSILILLGIFVLWSVFTKIKEINLCVIFITRAYQCLMQFKLLLLSIPVFIILMYGLVVLVGFQLLAFWSASDLKYEKNQVYQIPQGIFSVIFTVLCFIQLVWGFSFLKQTFNFIISGTTVTYFFLRRHYFYFGFSNLFKFHWGSVVAGSFMLVFFYIFDIIYDMIKPKSSNGTYSKYFNSVCCCLERIFGFARSEAMAYINITGIPYCNASRSCEQMNRFTDLYEGSQSVNRFFKISSHILLAALGTLYSVLYMQTIAQKPHLTAYIFNFILNMFVVTFFISLPADIAEALLTCTLVQQYVKSYQDVQKNRHNTRQSKIPKGYDVFPTQY